MPRAPSAKPRQPTPNLRRGLRVYQGTFDGMNNLAVAAHSWVEAVEAIKATGALVSLRAARLYGSITSNPEQVAAAVAAFPDVVTREMHAPRGPYVVRPRRDA